MASYKTYKTGAQRYNDRMDKIFAKSKELNEKNHGVDRFGSSKAHALEKMKGEKKERKYSRALENKEK
jgi:hypothetical protein